MTRRDRDRDPRADERARARSELVTLARDQVEPGVAGVGAPRQHGVVPQPRTGISITRPATPPPASTRKRAKRRTSRSGRRARISTPSSRSSRDSIGGPSAYSSASLPALRVRNEQLDELRSGRRTAARSARAGRPGPPLTRRDLQGLGEAVREPATMQRVDGVDLVQHELDGELGGADLPEHRVDRGAAARRAVPPSADASATWRTRSATSVSSSVAANPSTSCVRQAADEAHGVGDEIAPTLVLEPARGRIERLEEAVVDRCPRARSARSGASTCRRSCSRRARSSASASGAAACDVSRAACRAPRSRSLRSETRRRASRRSVSSCDSPGPRVPTPPPRRSRCCHMPRMRGRLYSSWASSTWSLPSALRACWAKMSRISCVRSTTRAWRRFSSWRCWEGASSSSTSSDSAPDSA